MARSCLEHSQSLSLSFSGGEIPREILRSGVAGSKGMCVCDSAKWLLGGF